MKSMKSMIQHLTLRACVLIDCDDCFIPVYKADRKPLTSLTSPTSTVPLTSPQHPQQPQQHNHGNKNTNRNKEMGGIPTLGEGRDNP